MLQLSVCRRVFAVAALVSVSAGAATYHVSPRGDDTATGNTAAQAFRTITRGIEALAPGDTLLVGPGIYHEQVMIETGGTRAQPITLRAEIPGRAELVGSIRLADWTPVRGRHQVFRTRLARVTRLVYEKDTDAEYIEAANLDQVEATPGSFHYAPDAQTLYVHPSDSLGMQHHVVDACVLDYGLASRSTHRGSTDGPHCVGLVIDGFVVRDYAEGGIFINNAEHCEIRNCIVHHCRRGIFTHNAYHSRIVGCEAFSCADRFNREMGNIGMMSYSFHCELLNNRSYATRQHGIRFYGAHYGCVMRGNLAYDCRIGMQVKGWAIPAAAAPRYARHFDGGHPVISPDLPPVLCERNVAYRTVSTALIASYSLYRHNTAVKAHAARAVDIESNIGLTVEQVATAGFADPAWQDLRLQADSPYRHAGHDGESSGAYPYADEVFFVSPTGSDTNAGSSVAAAWQTLAHAASQLAAGQTLYLLPGSYRGPLRLHNLRAAERATCIRAHGKGEVFIDGSGEDETAVEILGCRAVQIQGLRLRNTTARALVVQDSEDVLVSENEVFDNRGDGVAVAAGAGVRLVGNTVVCQAGRGVVVDQKAVGTWIVGNIVRDNASQLCFPQGLPPQLFCDLNNLGGPGPLATVTDTAYAGIAVWTAATGLDRRSIDADPAFVDLDRRDLTLQGTSPCRGRGYLGRAIGVGRVAADDALAFADVRVVATQAHSADIQWTVQRGRGTMVVAYGTDPAALETVIVRDTGHYYQTHHSTTLPGLAPETLYYFRVGSRRLLDGEEPFHSYNYSWPERTPAGEAAFYKTLGKVDTFGARVFSFATRARDVVSSQVYHVSVDGQDDAPGTEAAPFRRIRQATEVAWPGDRIVVHTGVYAETIRPRRSGVPGNPITIEAARGERVEINGCRELIPLGVNLQDRHHVIVRGFHFAEQTEFGATRGRYGQVFVVGAADIRIEQCLFDGRMNYVNGVHVYRSARIVVHNNIFVSHNVPMVCTDNEALTITRNTYLGPTIHKLYGPRNRNLRIRGNLFGENLFPKKKQQYKLSLGGVDEIDMDYNCYYFDPANDERRIVDYIPAGVDLAKVTGLPEMQKPQDNVARWGIKGDLSLWRETFGQDVHSIIAVPKWVNPDAVAKTRARFRGWPDRFHEYEPIRREDFALAAESPCLGGGENGTNIGADYTY